MATIYFDVYGSVQRRAVQLEKDEKQIAAPVRYTPDAEGSRLNLRSLGDKAHTALEAGALGPRPKHTRYNARLARRKAKAA